MRCLLCGSGAVAPVEQLPARKLIEDWRAEFGIEIADELAGSEVVSRYRCASCELEFYPPHLAGSSRLYSALEARSEYYPADKWEHRAALAEIRPEHRVLEVGCGSGQFLHLLRTRGVREVRGIELNPTAVQAGQALGLPVEAADLADLAREEPGSFDVVCAFQVLEHVPDPSGFVSLCVQLLRSGGRLLIGVPNAVGFLRHRYELLDMPPHHITRWAPAALRRLGPLHGLALAGLRFEPLAPYHVEAYVDTQLGRVAHLPGVARLAPRMRVYSWRLLAWERLRRMVRGHTVYVSYRKQ